MNKLLRVLFTIYDLPFIVMLIFCLLVFTIENMIKKRINYQDFNENKSALIHFSRSLSLVRHYANAIFWGSAIIYLLTN